MNMDEAYCHTHFYQKHSEACMATPPLRLVKNNTFAYFTNVRQMSRDFTDFLATAEDMTSYEDELPVDKPEAIAVNKVNGAIQYSSAHREFSAAETSCLYKLKPLLYKNKRPEDALKFNITISALCSSLQRYRTCASRLRDCPGKTADNRACSSFETMMNLIRRIPHKYSEELKRRLCPSHFSWDGYFRLQTTPQRRPYAPDDDDSEWDFTGYDSETETEEEGPGEEATPLTQDS